MSFATPLGLLALLAIPAVVALHMFRRRFRERRVTALFLFAPDRLRAHAGRTPSRLLHSASLWCEILAALLLALWLGGLSFGARSTPLHVVFVLDDSASMAAGDASATVADRAREEIARILDTLPSDAVATVILTGARPEIQLGPRELAKGSVARAIEAWQPWQPDHDEGPALDLGVELAGDHSRLYYFTDRLDAVEAPAPYTVLALGRAQDNVAISAARRERDPRSAGERLFIDVRSFCSMPQKATLSVRSAAADPASPPLLSQELDLAPDSVEHLALGVDGGLDAAWIVQLDAADALDIDDRFVLLPPPVRIVRVASTLAEDAARALELTRVLAALPRVRVTGDPSDAHLVIADIGADIRDAHELRIGIVGDAAATETWLGPYLIERRDELCSGLTLEGVVWTSGQAPLDGFPVASAGAQGLIARNDGLDSEQRGRIVVTLNLDPQRSNFAASPDWPILLSNLCERVRARLPGTDEVNVAVGGVLHWRRSAGTAGDALRLVDPDGNAWPGRGLELVTWQARQPGEFTLVDAAGTELARFAVHFSDARESDLRLAHTATREPQPEPIVAASALRADGVASLHGGVELRVLALGALLLMLLDWILLRRTR